MESLSQFNFISQASLNPEPRDVRELKLFGQFYMLEESAASSLSLRFARFLLENFGTQSILTWHMGFPSKKIRTSAGPKSFETILQSVSAASGCFACNGFFQSDAIYNRRTTAAYMYRCLYPAHGTQGYDTVPPDYRELFLRLMKDAGRDPDRIRGALLTLFSEEGRVPVMRSSTSDLQSSFASRPYENHPGKRHGKFSLQIPVSCAPGQVEALAQKMKGFLIEIGNEYTNLNAGVTMDAFSLNYDPNMLYFGNPQSVELDGSHRSAACRPIEWYPVYFLNGAHWFNLISPLAAAHLPTLTPGTREKIKIQALANGPWSVALDTEIQRTDISDLVPVKRLLYPALSPGGLKISLDLLLNCDAWSPMSKPRMYWERIPLFPEELTVTDTEVFFCRPVIEEHRRVSSCQIR